MSRVEEIINEINELEPIAARIGNYTYDNLAVMNRLEAEKNGENDAEIDRRIEEISADSDRVGEWMNAIMTHVVHIKCELAHIADKRIAREYIDLMCADLDPGEISAEQWEMVAFARRDFPVCA